MKRRKVSPITVAIMDDMIAGRATDTATVKVIVARRVKQVEAEIERLKKKNTALRHEVNGLRNRIGLARKYVEWNDKPTGGCPESRE